MVLGEGGVSLLPFLKLDGRVDVKEDMGAKLEGFGGAAGGVEIMDRRTVLTLLVEGDRSIAFLGSSVLGSGSGRSFVGVIGVNQPAYSWSRIERGVGEIVTRCG